MIKILQCSIQELFIELIWFDRTQKWDHVGWGDSHDIAWSSHINLIFKLILIYIIYISVVGWHIPFELLIPS